MVPRQRLAVGCLLSGLPCLANGYQFIQQEALINVGWGLVVAGTVISLVGAYLLYRLPQVAKNQKMTKNMGSKLGTSPQRKQAKK